jgi:hypothetical protein
VRLAFGGLAACLALAACGVKPPEVPAVEWRLEMRPSDAGSAYESLSAFALVKDPEGLDNVMELWVVCDSASLAWRAGPSDWIRSADGSDAWLGASALARADFSPMPRGAYRIIAIDAAGQRAEKSFTVSGEMPPRELKLELKDGNLTIGSDWPETLLLAFDGAGALIGSPRAPSGGSALAQALGQDLAARAAEIGAYGYDPTLKMGSFAKRIKTR